MIKSKLLFIIIVIGLLLLVAPVSAKTVTAKVDDKGILIDNRYGHMGTVHTCYGWITVSDEDYNQIMVNDTIRYDSDMIDWFWQQYWDVEVV